MDFVLYNSFSRTHLGHGTDRALVAGILGLGPADIRVRRSFELAREAGLGFTITEGGRDEGLHPNTVEIRMECEGGSSISVTGESLGGGRVRVSSIDGVRVSIAGDMPTIFVEHRDLPGVLAALTRTLSTANVNIATMSTFREERGGKAYTVFEVDEPVGARLLELLGATDHVEFATQVNVPGAAGASAPVESGLSFASGSQLLAACGARQLSIGELMRAREVELAGDAADLSPDAAMARVLEVMRSETTEAITRPKVSLGGLLSRQAADVASCGEGGLAGALLGTTLTRATAFAMATLERSATMGVIGAAPTAGSAGVLPGALSRLRGVHGRRGCRHQARAVERGSRGGACLHQRNGRGRRGRLSGRGWHGFRHGCERPGGASRRHARAVPGCGLARDCEHARAGLRPCGRHGGVPLPGEKRYGRGVRDELGAAGALWRGLPHSL